MKLTMKRIKVFSQKVIDNEKLPVVYKCKFRTCDTEMRITVWSYDKGRYEAEEDLSRPVLM